MENAKVNHFRIPLPMASTISKGKMTLENGVLHFSRLYAWRKY